MKYQFGDGGESSAARANKIRALFHGGTLTAHTEICIDAGLWTDSELRAKALRGCKDEVRAALTATIDGLPWAGETPYREEGKPVWRQLDFWDYETFVFNIGRRKAQTASDVDVINRLVDRCRERFGVSPKKSALSDIEEEPEG